MPKQFLLNPDGSIPEGTDVAMLEYFGIPMAIPTEMPRVPGMIAIEQEPEQDADGVWHQVWKLEPESDVIVPLPTE